MVKAGSHSATFMRSIRFRCLWLCQQKIETARVGKGSEVLMCRVEHLKFEFTYYGLIKNNRQSLPQLPIRSIQRIL